MTDPTRARTPMKTTTTMAVTVDDQAYAKEASARCVGCGLIDKLDTIIQHASTCKITVVVKEEGNKGSQTHTNSSDSQTVSCQDLSWMPSSFSLLKRDGGYVSGIVHSEEELLTLLADHKRATLSSFNFWYNSEGRQRKAENVGKQRKLLWHVEDYCEDTPLSVTKRVIMSCQHGKERKNTASKGDSLAYVYTRKRHFEKRVKKLDCPAKVFIRHMKRYDTFRVERNASKYKKKETMKKLKLEIAKTTPPTSTNLIHVKLPLVEAHQNHPMDSGCGHSRRKRRKVKGKTLEMAEAITPQQGAQPPHTDTIAPQGAQPPHTDTPSFTPLDTAHPEYTKTNRRPRIATLCPVCFKPYLTMANHLRKTHKVANKEERVLLLDMVAKRVDIRDAACPVSGCDYKSNRLYTHLLVDGHPGLSKEEAERYMDKVRKERTVGLLAELRATNPCPAMVTDLDLQTHWMVCMDREQQLVEEAVIPTYGEWEAEEPESEDNPCADYECAKRLERCREANEKLTLTNRRLEVQLSELKMKYKLLERKHRGLCEATGVT